MFTLCIFLHSFPGVHHISPLQGNKDISFSSVLCGDYFYPKVEEKKKRLQFCFIICGVTAWKKKENSLDWSYTAVKKKKVCFIILRVNMLFLIKSLQWFLITICLNNGRWRKLMQSLYLQFNRMPLVVQIYTQQF